MSVPTTCRSQRSRRRGGALSRVILDEAVRAGTDRWRGADSVLPEAHREAYEGALTVRERTRSDHLLAFALEAAAGLKGIQVIDNQIHVRRVRSICLSPPESGG